MKIDKKRCAEGTNSYIHTNCPVFTEANKPLPTISLGEKWKNICLFARSGLIFGHKRAKFQKFPKFPEAGAKAKHFRPKWSTLCCILHLEIPNFHSQLKFYRKILDEKLWKPVRIFWPELKNNLCIIGLEEKWKTLCNLRKKIENFPKFREAPSRAQRLLETKKSCLKEKCLCWEKVLPFVVTDWSLLVSQNWSLLLKILT